MKLLNYNIQKVNDNDIPMYNEYFGNNRPVMLNFGGSKHPLWQNFDRTNLVGDDITILRDNNTVDFIYISNILEGLTELQVYSFLSECYRVLKRNGYMRITTKNINLANYARQNKDIYHFDHVKNFKRYSLNQLFINEFATQCSAVSSDTFISDKELDTALYSVPFFEVLDEITTTKINLAKHKIGDNINWFNIYKIESILKSKIGINKNLFISQYGQSNVPVMRNVVYFDNYLPQKSLYFEIRK